MELPQGIAVWVPLTWVIMLAVGMLVFEYYRCQREDVQSGVALGEWCEAMDQAGKSGDTKALATLLPKLMAEMAAVNDFLGFSYDKPI